MPAHFSEEGNVMSVPLWIALAVVNAGAWALGVATATALADRRTAH